MNNKTILALDAMGGDFAPLIVVEGASIVANKNKNIFFKFFGDKTQLNPILEKHSNLNGRYEVIHTSDYVKSDEKPTEVIRRKDTSMYMAIQSVKDGESSAIVSAGNTGALMALSTIILRPITGIYRTAIATYFPTNKNSCVMLDLGANSENNKEHLNQFAIMGSIFSKILIKKENPTVGLLNIGSEKIKGTTLVQETSELLEKNSIINYKGFAEGDAIFSGNFDVIVTDGFTGNVALKVIEGTSRFIKKKVSSVFKGFFQRVLALVFFVFFFKKVLKVKEEIDPRNYNGAMLIGLQGISIKSHGNADKKSYASAIMVAYQMVKGNVVDEISNHLEKMS